mmetsp:Transcript_6298/g.9662  ORF Transcript_6298/g.9662 Transcript_6298/m.9662 type:complete len:1065 (-) Transcript_6298:90-3284(-)
MEFDDNFFKMWDNANGDDGDSQITLSEALSGGDKKVKLEGATSFAAPADGFLVPEPIVKPKRQKTEHSTPGSKYSDLLPDIPGIVENHTMDSWVGNEEFDGGSIFDDMATDENLLSTHLKKKKTPEKKARKRTREPVMPLGPAELLPMPAGFHPKKVGDMFATVVGSDKFNDAGKVRKNDIVNLQFDEEHEVWEVVNSRERKIGLVEDGVGNVLYKISEMYKTLQKCKITVGNDSLLSEWPVVRITILSDPSESEAIDNYLKNAFSAARKYKDVYKTARRPRINRPVSIGSVTPTSGLTTPVETGHDPWKAQEAYVPGPAGLTPVEGAQSALAAPLINLAGPQTEEVKTIEEIETDLDKLFMGSDNENLPEARESQRVKTRLYPYQRQGLYWMQLQESVRALSEGDGFLGWEKRTDDGREVWYNKINKQTRKKAPERWRGGILADEMGLGKTLQIISVIAGTARDVTKGIKHKGPGSTLIVCPLSVITNWEMQCKRHIRKDAPLKVHTYHGPNRIRDRRELKKYDVIITTYSIVSQEYRDPEEERRKLQALEAKYQEECRIANEKGFNPPSKPKALVKAKDDKDKDGKKEKNMSALHSIKFLRIVLDEAHIIRDRKTRQCKACIALKAERRWCITGTPFQNKVDDAYSLLAFLRVEPFTNHTWWNKLITQPLKQQQDKGMKNLQKIMTMLCLRRKKTDHIKGKKILPLPPKKDIIQKIRLSGHEQTVYDALASSGKRRFKSIMSQSRLGEKNHFAFVLQMLLRMRQACDDINLVPTRYHNGFQSNEALDLEEQVITMWDESPTDECEICLRKPSDPCLSSVCGHKYCQSCLAERWQQAGPGGMFCPSCDKRIDKGDIITEKNIVELKDKRTEMDKKQLEAIKSSNYRSTKVRTLIQALQKIGQVDRSFKAVIFSQFTSMLDIVHSALTKEGYKCSRIDGRMSSQNRKRNIQDFAQNPSCKIFLISLKAGGMGLNLTAANTVFLLDPWWNPAAEDQAVARIHRCGQNKPVNIIRFITSNTVEEKILDLQKTKRDMMTTALTRFNRSKGQLRQERIKNLKKLFSSK